MSMSEIDEAFIERMIEAGEFAPGARGMNPFDALVQWGEVNAVERVRIVFRDRPDFVGTWEVVPRAADMNLHIAVGTELRVVVLSVPHGGQVFRAGGVPVNIHPDVVHVECADGHRPC